jgi:serine protease Do
VVQEIDPGPAKGFGLPTAGGALVNDVTAGSAAQGRLQVGDVIRRSTADGGHQSDLPPLIGAMAPGSKVTLGVVRDGKPRTVNAVLDNQRTASAPGEDDDADATAGVAAPATAETALGLGVADLTRPRGASSA